jgi:VanZ family protein
MAAIFLASGTSDPGVNVAGWDKLLHAIAYLILGLLTLRACHGGVCGLRAGATVAALAITIGYGLVDELHQSRVPDRHASVGDWAADTIGAVLALPVAMVWDHLKERFRGPAPGVES